MSIQIYNTLTKSKQDFQPLSPPHVKMYVCGPTVYDFLHIGNFRGPIFFNVVRNWLTESGYQVDYVFNYTDVDDKIIKRANEEQKESHEISERFIDEFEKDFSRLKLTPHTTNPKVTESMEDIIKLIEKLVANEMAYIIEGEVFYRVEKFAGYTELSGKKLDDLNSGHRVEVDTKKESPLDFVLWKPSKAGEPSWDSPWGKGRPGWHIECSAMIHRHLGETIDIHGGGVDLIFPHHTNEIAQGEGATGEKYCQVWMHNNFINLNDQKMSKSLGNVLKARDFMDKYHPEILKFVMLSTHYRSMMNVDEEKIQQSISGLARVYKALRDAKQILTEAPAAEGESSLSKKTQEATKKIATALNDDFNTSEVLSFIFEVVRDFNQLNLVAKKKTANSATTATQFIEWLTTQGKILALFGETPEEFLSHLDEILIQEKNIDKKYIEELIEKRRQARAEKDFKTSDEVRDELLALDVLIHDGTSGTTWEMKK